MKCIFLCLFSLLALVSSEKEWWETGTFYQIYPRSFRDSDGDGIGDLKGILQKLGHLKELGITAAWLSPIMKSPMVDFGYDISDFKAIDEIFGTMDDFKQLLKKAKELDIKIIMDFVPNHSSDEHEWFEKSVKREEGYENYYIWKDGKNCTDIEEWDPEEKIIPCDPPNNWNAVFRGSAWEWNWKRGQFYYHQFHPRQPDLNFRNPKVEQEMKDILEFWLEMGVDGFRIDAINHLMEDENWPDEPRNPDVDDPESYSYTLKHYSLDQMDTYDRVYDWREVLDKWTKKTNETKILMTEAYANMSSVMLYYQSVDGKRQGAHFPFNFMLIFQRATSTADDFLNAINEWMTAMPEGKTANWVLGNHDRARFGSNYGSHRIASMHTIALTLPGVSVTYYGDEIGMLDHRDISWEDTVDPQACKAPKEDLKEKSRDPARTPFQWDDSFYGGFADFLKQGAKLWLPLHPNHKRVNLKNQKNDEDSIYNYFRKLAAFRKNKTIQEGSFNITAIGKHILAYIRALEGSKTFVIVANLGEQRQTVDLTEFSQLQSSLKVELSGVISQYKEGDIVETKSVTITAGDTIVFSSNKANQLFCSVILMVMITVITFL